MNKLITIVGTTPILTLESLLKTGEHFFEDNYRLHCFDTQPLSRKSPLSGNFAQLSVSDGKNIFLDNDNLIEFIKSFISDDDLQKIKEFNPTAGGAGGKWEGGFCAFFSQMDFIRRGIKGFLSEASEPFDVIITGGSMGGTKSGFFIPMIFAVGYILTREFRNNKDYRLNLIITIPDERLEQRPTTIRDAWKDNAIFIFKYLSKFLNFMKKEGQINRILVYFINPGQGSDMDNRTLLKVISLLTNDQIPSRLIDVPTQQGKNYFVIHFKDKFFFLKRLREYLKYHLIGYICETEKQNLQTAQLKNYNGVIQYLIGILKSRIQKINKNEKPVWISDAIEAIDSVDFFEELKKRFSFNTYADYRNMKSMLDENNDEYIEKIMEESVINLFYLQFQIDEIYEDEKDQIREKIKEKFDKLNTDLENLIKDYQRKLDALDSKIMLSKESLKKELDINAYESTNIHSAFISFFQTSFAVQKNSLLNIIYKENTQELIEKVEKIVDEYFNTNLVNVKVKVEDFLKFYEELGSLLGDLNRYMFHGDNFLPIHKLTQKARSDTLPYIAIWVNYLHMIDVNIISNSLQNFDNLGAVQPQHIEIKKEIQWKINNAINYYAILKHAFICFMPFKDIKDLECVQNGYYSFKVN